jgi:hypothetical protein
MELLCAWQSSICSPVVFLRGLRRPNEEMGAGDLY